jgi:hypothetical protein
MKVLSADLLDSVTTVWDKTKTYIAGRVFQKTINSNSVLGPPLTNFIDVFTDTASGGSITPNMDFESPNGRLFIINTPAAGVATILLYDKPTNGQSNPVYVGRILVNLPNTAATTHTLRHFKVYDGPNAGTVTGWKIVIGTTGSVLINGGTFTVYGVAKSNFVPISPPTFGLAIASAANAVYMHQDPTAIGVNNNLTANAGGSLDLVNQISAVHNGTAAAGQFFKLDLTVSPAVVLQTTTSPTSIGSPTFTMTGHGFNNNDPVVQTANNPTGFTLSTATTQVVYFVRNAAANTFELSATSGGASINATSATASTVFTRAFGTSVSAWTNTKTGNITGVSGTLLTNNSENFATPNTAIDPNIPAAISGFDCIFFATSTGFYMFKMSEITLGATSFPSMQSVNCNGTGTDFTGITVATAAYSSTLGVVVYTSNTSAFYCKRWLPNNILLAFGGLSTAYWENTPSRQTTNFSSVTISNLDTRLGWLSVCGTTVGQRGVFYLDLYSDHVFDNSYIISKVIDTSGVNLFEFVQTIEELFNYTNSMVFGYRTSDNYADAIFASPTGGPFTDIPFAENLNSFNLQDFTQVKIGFDIATLFAQSPAQVSELFLAVTKLFENSQNWFTDNEHSTKSTDSPPKSAAILVKAYPTSVPAIRLQALSRATGLAVLDKNTSAHAAEFQYSSNSGTSWNALGTIPNTINTTRLRYNWSTPIPEDVDLVWTEL